MKALGTGEVCTQLVQEGRVCPALRSPALLLPRQPPIACMAQPQWLEDSELHKQQGCMRRMLHAFSRFGSCLHTFGEVSSC